MRYQWQDLCVKAVLEIDSSKLAHRIEKADKAIEARVNELEQDHGGTEEERDAIGKAINGLEILRKERT